MIVIEIVTTASSPEKPASRPEAVGLHSKMDTMEHTEQPENTPGSLDHLRLWLAQYLLKS
jgi:hypothetical protein